MNLTPHIRCLVLLLLVGIQSQSYSQPIPQVKSMKPNSLAHGMESIQQGDLSEWQGLPMDLNLPQINAVLGTPVRQGGYVISSKLCTLSRYALEGQSQPLQVFKDESGAILLFRLEDPLLLHSANELVERWGEPDQKRILPNDHPYAPSSQWIFARRGVTLYVMDAAKKEYLSLLAASFYAPTEADLYLRQLGGNERVRFSRF